MYITTKDYQQLTGLVGLASLKVKMPEIINRLFNEFKGAKMVRSGAHCYVSSGR